MNASQVLTDDQIEHAISVLGVLNSIAPFESELDREQFRSVSARVRNDLIDMLSDPKVTRRHVSSACPPPPMGPGLNVSINNWKVALVDDRGKVSILQANPKDIAEVRVDGAVVEWTITLTPIVPTDSRATADMIDPSADDPVDHPAHYTGFSNGAEVIDIAENLMMNRGNAIKYLARAGAKDPAKEVEDLRKAAWYVQREIERVERGGAK